MMRPPDLKPAKACVNCAYWNIDRTEHTVTAFCECARMQQMTYLGDRCIGFRYRVEGTPEIKRTDWVRADKLPRSG